MNIKIKVPILAVLLWIILNGIGVIIWTWPFIVAWVTDDSWWFWWFFLSSILFIIYNSWIFKKIFIILFNKINK